MGAAEPFNPAVTPSAPPPGPAAESSLTILPVGDPRRAQAEALVRTCFHEAWGARVSYFLPWLLALGRPPHGPEAVLGFRPAGDAPLFLEGYLDDPAERALARVVGRPVARPEVTEVGNLAVGFPGGARHLAVALTAFLDARAADWVVFTARTALRNTFNRLGIELCPLVEARPERLPGGGREWGRYYDEGPWVVAAHAQQAAAAVRARLPRAKAPLMALWEQGQGLGAATGPGADGGV